MHLLLVQLIEGNLIQQIKGPKWFSILVDDVIESAITEQLFVYIAYVDEEEKPHFDFLEKKDVHEPLESADFTNIMSRIIIDELKASGLNLSFSCCFGSDSASTMTGKRNRVDARFLKGLQNHGP